MQLANPRAFTPFMTSTVIVRFLRRDGAGDTLKLKASVVAGDPYQATSGDADACSQYSVTFKASQIKTNFKITQGCMIDTDGMNNAWPRLIVQRVYTLGGITILNCSADERGARA